MGKKREMDIQAEKIRLIEWLAGLNDPRIIKELITIKKNKEADWWDEISEEEKKEIQVGVSQADNGEVKSHEIVMEIYKKWL